MNFIGRCGNEVRLFHNNFTQNRRNFSKVESPNGNILKKLCQVAKAILIIGVTGYYCKILSEHMGNKVIGEWTGWNEVEDETKAKAESYAKSMALSKPLKVLEFPKDPIGGAAFGCNYLWSHPIIFLGHKSNDFTIAHEISHIMHNHELKSQTAQIAGSATFVARRRPLRIRCGLRGRLRERIAIQPRISPSVRSSD